VRRPAGELLHLGEVWPRTQLLEHSVRSLQLQLRAILVPLLAAGESHQDTGTRGLVRRLEFLPGPPRLAQRLHGGSGVTLGEEDRAEGLGGQGMQKRRVDAGGKLG
jgi:hypothetical protein